MKKAKYISFISIAFVICLLQIIFMPISDKHNKSNERGATTDFPSIFEDEAVNTNFGADLNSYISDNFAMRKEIINFQAKSRNKVFKTSNNDKVIIGKNGFLFFSETLNDYEGNNVISKRRANNTAKMLQIIQNAVENNGGKFTLAIVPNKNTIYPQYMPSRYSRGEISNIDILTPYLNKYSVNYTDLFTPFKQEKSIIYCKTDSHWNNRGALIGDRIIMKSLGRNSLISVNDNDFIKRFDYSGDLSTMLYPTNTAPLESNYYYGIENNYQCINNMPLQSIRVATKSNTGEGNLMMYRDSFGDALIPYISQEFENSVFSKAVPYNISIASNANCVIIEKTQRHINTFTDGIPYIHLNPVNNITAKIVKTNAKIKCEKIDNDILIYGNVDKNYTNEDSPIYLEIKSENNIVTYEAFPCKYELSDSDGDYSFGLYLDKNQFKNSSKYDVSVITAFNGTYVRSSSTLNIH